jgi:vacuolar-type H+-ATPase subunit C/Vma6
MFGEEYASVYPKVKSWAGTLVLTKDKCSEMLSMNLADYKQYLKSLSKKISLNTEDNVQLEGQLKQEGYYFIESISRYLMGYTKDFVNYLGKMLEIENLKLVTRALLNKRPVNFLYKLKKMSRIQMEFVKDIKTLEEFHELLSGTEYYRLATDAIPRIESENTTFYFEMNLDNYYANNIKKKVSKLGPDEKQQVKNIFYYYMNVNRLLWIYRAKFNYSMSNEEIIAIVPNIQVIFNKAQYQALLDSETKEDYIENLKKSGFLEIRNPDHFDLEREMHYQLLIKGKSCLSGYPFSLGVFLGFFVLNIIHVKNLITVLEAKKLDIDPARVMDLLIYY